MLFEKSKYTRGYKVTLCPVGATPGYQSVRTMMEHIVDIYEDRVPVGASMEDGQKFDPIVLKKYMMYPKYCSWGEHHIVKSMLVEFCDMKREISESLKRTIVLELRKFFYIIYFRWVIQILIKTFELEGLILLKL